MKDTLKAIGFETPACYERAAQLAAELNLPLDQVALPRLQVTPDKLQLLLPQFNPLYVDFVSLALLRRRAVGKQQGLVRACVLKPGIRILDATTGWGRDAAILASFGARVLMLEREPLMVALLRDGLARLELSKINLSLSLVAMDTKDYLGSLVAEDHPDVIYIDPMHPERQKSALVKKDLQALQQFIGADEDALALIEMAIPKALERVVVKWPERLPPLLKPTFSLHGKTVRFDVYQGK